MFSFSFEINYVNVIILQKESHVNNKKLIFQKKKQFSLF